MSLYDIQRAAQVILSWLKPKPAAREKAASPEKPASGGGVRNSGARDPSPRILRPAMLPSFSRPWMARLNQVLLSRAVRKALAGVAPGKRPILVSTLPIIPRLFRDPAFRKKVYYCVDDFTEWAGIDGSAMLRLERETLAACDLLIATSTPILESRGRGLPRAKLLTHGVDASHFSRAVRSGTSPLASLKGPIVGIFGVFDRRIDNALFRAAAQSLPDATFAVVGPVVDQDPAEFADLPNVRFLGPVPYAELPGHVAWFDVCILPYLVDRTTVSINPLKLKEYLATGKPVVATPLPEAVRLGSFLRVAEPAAFPAAISDAVAAAVSAAAAAAAADAQGNPSPRNPDLDAFLAGESWEAKAGRFVEEILEGL